MEKAFKNSRLTEIQKENLSNYIVSNLNFDPNNIQSNLISLEKTTLKDLKYIDNIVITTADKGNRSSLYNLCHP